MKTRQQIIKEAILNELMTATQRYVAKSPVRAAGAAIKGFVTGQGAREGVRQAALADYVGDARESLGRADNREHMARFPHGGGHDPFVGSTNPNNPRESEAARIRADSSRNQDPGINFDRTTTRARVLGIQRASNRIGGQTTPPTR